MKEVFYTDEVSRHDGNVSVTFLVKESGARLTRFFDSEFLARKFINKLRHSRKCTFLSTSGFLL